MIIKTRSSERRLTTHRSTLKVNACIGGGWTLFSRSARTAKPLGLLSSSSSSPLPPRLSLWNLPAPGVISPLSQKRFLTFRRRQYFSWLSRQTVYWVERPSFLQRREIARLWRRWLYRAETCSPEMIGYFSKWESLRNVFFSVWYLQRPSHNVQTETSECLQPPNNTWIVNNSKVGKYLSIKGARVVLNLYACSHLCFKASKHTIVNYFVPYSNVGI